MREQVGAMMTEHARPTAETAYMIETEGQRIRPYAMDETFWPRMVAGEIAGDALISFFRMEGDFDHWEMHPNGDELFILHDGAIEVVLDSGGRKETVRLEARETCLIPKGVWHWARLITPGHLTVITFGTGTEHRPL